MAILGDLRNGYFPVFVGQVRGRRLWDLCIEEFFEDPGDRPAQTLIKPERDLRLSYGKSRNTLWTGALASALRMRIKDNAEQLFGRLIAAREAGLGDSKFRARLNSRDGIYSWEGWLRLDTTDRPASTITGLPITQVYAYDGQADLTNVAALNGTEESNHALFRNILSYSLSPLCIRYRNQWRGTNMAAGAALPRIVFREFANVNGPPFRPKASRATSMAEALRAMLARSWQGLDGSWHVAQAWLLGRALQAGQGAERFDYLTYNPLRDELSEVVEEDATSGAFELRPSMFAGTKPQRFLKGLHLVNSRLEIRRQSPAPFFRGQAQQNYQFTTWDGDVFRYGTITSDPIRFDSRGEFNASMRFEPGGTWELERFIIDADEDVFLDVNFKWAGERVSGAGDVQMRFQYVIEPTDGSATYYLASDGTWSQSVQNLDTAAQTPDVNGAPVLTFYEAQVSPVEATPTRGRHILRFLGEASSKTDNLFLTRLWWRPITSGGDDLDMLSFNTTYQRLDAGGEPKGGDTLAFTMGIINLANQVGLVGDGHVNVYDGTIWQQLSKWQSLAGGGPWPDLTELMASVILAEDTEKLRDLKGPIRGIFPPERIPVFDCIPYLWLDGYIDFIDEITNARWVQKPGPYDLAT